MKFVMEIFYASYSIAKMLAAGRNPISPIRTYKANRGMSWYIDIIDWLGGYPYEFASADEVFLFCKKEFGFELENLKTVNGLANNQFLFINRVGTLSLEHH